MIVPLRAVWYTVTVSAIISACLAQVHIHGDTSFHKKKQSTDMWASSSSKKQGKGTQLVKRQGNNNHTLRADKSLSPLFKHSLSEVLHFSNYPHPHLYLLYI